MPNRFNVLVIQGVVGLVKIHPETHPLGHFFPVADITHNRLSTTSGKFCDPDLRLDFLFVEDTQFFLDFVLYWQAVGIPTALPRGMKTAHCLVAWVNILECTGEYVMYTGTPVGCWRPFVEGEQRAAFGIG